MKRRGIKCLNELFVCLAVYSSAPSPHELNNKIKLVVESIPMLLLPLYRITYSIFQYYDQSLANTKNLYHLPAYSPLF